MKVHYRFHVILFTFLILACAKPQRDKKPPEPAESCVPPNGVCFVREMDFIPEIDTWPACTTKVSEDLTQEMLAAWSKKLPEIEKLVTPELARSLSQWAQKQMKGYDSIPSLSKLTFKPVREYNNLNKIVYEATVDTLPTHINIVTRWLVIYVLWDIHSDSVIRTTVTIRGEKLE